MLFIKGNLVKLKGPQPISFYGWPFNDKTTVGTFVKYCSKTYCQIHLPGHPWWNVRTIDLELAHGEDHSTVNTKDI